MLKNKKALSLTTMVITVMIMFVIMGTMVYSAVDSVKIRKLNKLYNDLRQLSDAVEVYSLKNSGQLPVYDDRAIVLNKSDNAGEKNIGFVLKKGTTAETGNFLNPNDFYGDKAEYKYLNLGLLENISLNYNEENGYIINTRSHTIYYMTGLSIGGETYNSLPLTYIDTGYGIAPTANFFNLKMISGLTNGVNTIYFSPSNNEIYLRDLIEFETDEEENDEVELESVKFSLDENSKYFDLNEETGLLTRKSGVNEVSNITDEYTTEVTVEAKNIDSEEVMKKSFIIATSSINLCSTNSSNTGPIEEVNLVSNEENKSLVYKKISTDNKEIKIDKKGFLRTKNSLNMIPTADNTEIASATYNDEDKTKYVVVNSGNVAGTTELTLEVQDYGLAKDTITVNVFDFELNNEADKEKKKIEKLEFSEIGNDEKVNLKLNYQGPKDFRFDGERNKLNWSIVNDKNEIDNSEIVDLSVEDDFGTSISLTPKKVGKTNLKCEITVGREIIAEMMIPITVSDLK